MPKFDPYSECSVKLRTSNFAHECTFVQQSDLSTNHNTYLKISTGELLKLGLVEKVVKVKIFCTGRLSYENTFGCKVDVLGLRASTCTWVPRKRPNKRPKNRALTQWGDMYFSFWTSLQDKSE